MFDASDLPNVDDLGLEEAGAIAYACQMAARENALHAIFGTTDPPDQIMSPGDPNLLVNWPGGGVYQYPPHDERSSWHYVTSGLSQPDTDNDGNAQPIVDEDGERFSGFGIELVISTSSKAAWVPGVLVNLVKYLLFQESARVILPGDRIPCGGPLALKTDTPLTYLVATTSDEYETEILLPVGKCQLVTWSVALKPKLTRQSPWATAGSIVLCRVLKELGVHYDSSPDRRCLAADSVFAATWDRVKSQCESEWAHAENEGTSADTIG